MGRNSKNPDAVAFAVKNVRFRLLKAKELGIDKIQNDAKLTDEQKSEKYEEIVKSLVEAKLANPEEKRSESVVTKGQRYYVETLVAALETDAETLMESAYDEAILDVVGFDEAIELIKSLKGDEA